MSFLQTFIFFQIFRLKLKMWTILVVHMWVLAIPALGENHLSCRSQGCLCNGTGSVALYCNFNQSVFRLPRSIVIYTKHVKITGTNFSVDISDQNYDSSWSVLETLEIYGHGGRRQQLTLPYKFTKKLSQVKLLRIRNAGLVSIERSAFSKLNAVVELDFSNNEFLNVKEIEKAFSGYTANKLETLNISGIHSSRTMRPLMRAELSPLKSLLNLDISWTRAAFQNKGTIPQFPYVYVLIQNIIPNIVTLNMSRTQSYNTDSDQTNCNFRIPVFNKFKNLTVLRLDYWAVNGTESAPPCTDLFAFENGCYRLPARLKKLHLNHANAKKFYIDFEKDVCISSKLEHLSLRNLNVSGPVGKITGLNNLKFIDISNTRFPFSLQLFFDMPSVEEIDASGNNLYKIENETRFPGLLEKNAVLKKISLRDNGFFELPDNLFSQNILLESIDISRNRLQYLKLNLTACLHLQQLSVAHNRLKMIDSSVTSHLDSLVSGTNKKKVMITIEGNELTCDCDGTILVAWIQETNVTVNVEEIFTCNTNELQEVRNYNCSVEVTISLAPTTIAKKNELKYILGAVLGSGLCAVCLFIIVILLHRKYRSRKLQTVQEYSLQNHIVSNDEDQHIILNCEEVNINSNGEDPDVISKDEEPRIILKHKGLQNNAHNKFDRAISGPNFARMFNENESQKNDSAIYKREISMPDEFRLLDTSEPQNDFSGPVSAFVSHDLKDKRDKNSETHKKPLLVPESIYFIGLSETRFESNKRTPHFAAFLAYSHHDKDFVVSKLYRVLQRQLEKYIPSWNQELLTVLYDKNFLPGQCTMDLIRAAVFSSYVTVAIVSDSFVKSTWCHYEMEAAIEAKVPIISVYLPGSDTDKFPAIMKYIYHNHVRMFWPDTANELLKLSDEEAGIINNLAFSISTYVKQPAP